MDDLEEIENLGELLGDMYTLGIDSTKIEFPENRRNYNKEEIQSTKNKINDFRLCKNIPIMEVYPTSGGITFKFFGNLYILLNRKEHLLIIKEKEKNKSIFLPPDFIELVVDIIRNESSWNLYIIWPPTLMLEIITLLDINPKTLEFIKPRDLMKILRSHG